MDGFTLVIALLMGFMAVMCVNGGYTSEYSRKEKYALNGVLRPMDLPKVPASAAVIARDRHRERRGLAGSTVLTAAALVALLPTGGPTIKALFFVLLSAAFVGRGVVVSWLTARDALNQPAGAPVSGRPARTLRGWTPRWPWVAVTALQAGFLLAYVPTSLALNPTLNPWVLGLAAASVALSAAGWVFARWLAPQPQLAADAAELAWSDAYRRRDLLTVLLIGPFVAVGVTVSAFTYGGDGPGGDPVGHLPLLALGYALAAGVIAFIGNLRATARSRNTVVEEPVHAER